MINSVWTNCPFRDTPTCVCDSGYDRNQTDTESDCLNINECFNGDACLQTEICFDTIGSYQCLPSPSKYLSDKAVIYGFDAVQGRVAGHSKYYSYHNN